MKKAAFFAGIAAVMAPALAVPPPVPVNVVLLVVGEPPETLASAQRMLRVLDGSYLSLAGFSEAGDAFRDCAGEEKERLHGCLASKLQAESAPGNSVVMLVRHPGWKGAQMEAICVGPDPRRAQTTSLHLRDAAHADEEIARDVKSAAAACLIGALHAPAQQP